MFIQEQEEPNRILGARGEEEEKLPKETKEKRFIKYARTMGEYFLTGPVSKKGGKGRAQVEGNEDEDGEDYEEEWRGQWRRASTQDIKGYTF